MVAHIFNDRPKKRPCADNYVSLAGSTEMVEMKPKKHQDRLITTTTHQRTVEMMIQASRNMKELPKAQWCNETARDDITFCQPSRQKPFWPQIVRRRET